MIIPKALFLPPNVFCYRGAVRELVRVTAGMCPQNARGLIVHGRSLVATGELERITRTLGATHPAAYCHTSGEPTVDDVSKIITVARKETVTWIAAVGGGSVMDAAKAAAGLFNAPKPPRYYQQGGKLEEAGIPFIAVPTTAGSGAEATANAVIIDPEQHVKLSIRDSRFMAHAVILDADLLQHIPRDVLAHAAMDSLVQAYESYISRHATWFSENLALQALTLVSTHLVRAYETSDPDTLEQLLIASFLGGMAFSSSRLGVIHGIAHPLGALYGVSHGLICAWCLIPSVTLNREVLGPKYDRLSAAVGRDFLTCVEQLIHSLELISPFRGQILQERNHIIEETLKSGSTAANPKEITSADVEWILDRLFLKSKS